MSEADQATPRGLLIDLGECLSVLVSRADHPPKCRGSLPAVAASATRALTLSDETRSGGSTRNPDGWVVRRSLSFLTTA